MSAGLPVDSSPDEWIEAPISNEPAVEWSCDVALVNFYLDGSIEIIVAKVQPSVMMLQPASLQLCLH